MKRAGVLIFLLAAVSSLTVANEVRFAVIGDTQGTDNGDSINRVVLARMVDEILNIDPPVEFVVIVGDLVTGYCDDDALLGSVA